MVQVFQQNTQTEQSQLDKRWHAGEPSPFRPSVHFKYKPHWRWDLAADSVKTKKTPYRVGESDPVLGRVIAYQRGLQATLKDRTISEKLARKFPDIHEVSQIYLDAGYPRWTIEALIVSNAKPSEICSAYPISPRLLELYRRVFFDIVDLLPLRNYMLPLLFGPLIDRIPGHDPDLTWKFFAYVGGLDAFQAFVDPSVDMGAAQQKLFETILNNRRIRNAVVAAMTVVPNNWNAIDLQRVHNEFETVKLQRKNSGSGGAVEACVGGMLQSVSYMLGENLAISTPTESGRGTFAADNQDIKSAIVKYVMGDNKSER